MCGGHNHVNHNIPFGYSNHRAAEPVYRPVDHASVTTPCPECGYPTQEDFVLCPRCGTQLLTACPECHRAVKTDWVRCAYCSADLTEPVINEKKEV
jgi:RNA polymerase subunit RPABC4/transcription elongation factor Spt4